MKVSSMFNINIGFYAKKHPQDRFTRSRIPHPGQKIRNHCLMIIKQSMVHLVKFHMGYIGKYGTYRNMYTLLDE